MYVEKYIKVIKVDFRSNVVRTNVAAPLKEDKNN
jgi:hypothetical protein